MYRKFYGLIKPPFDLTPDPEVVFMSPSHQEALAVLRYGVLSGKGFLVLTGNVGTGKTTLLRALTSSIEANIHSCLLNNPKLSREEFFSLLAHQYGLPYEGNKAHFLISFAEFLQQCHAGRERVLLLVDEAHVLPVDLLEEVRLLSNQEGGQEVFSIFLVGQPELNERMLDSRLLPLRQRIGMRFHLEPFSREETLQYILFRLRRAGARQLQIFDAKAVDLIHAASKGTPRLINIICDQALLTGFSTEKPLIGVEIIKECIQDLHFPGEAEVLPVTGPQAVGGTGRLLRSLLFGLAAVCVVLLVLLLMPVVRQIVPSIGDGSWWERLRDLWR